MAKTRTRKYFIETVIADGLITKLEVSEKQFKTALQSAEMQHKAQAGVKGDDFYIERREKCYKHTDFTEQTTIYEWSITSIWFRALTCTEGHQFVR